MNRQKSIKLLAATAVAALVATSAVAGIGSATGGAGGGKAQAAAVAFPPGPSSHSIIAV